MHSAFGAFCLERMGEQDSFRLIGKVGGRRLCILRADGSLYKRRQANLSSNEIQVGTDYCKSCNTRQIAFPTLQYMKDTINLINRDKQVKSFLADYAPPSKIWVARLLGLSSKQIAPYNV